MQQCNKSLEKSLNLRPFDNFQEPTKMIGATMNVLISCLVTAMATAVGMLTIYLYLIEGPRPKISVGPLEFDAKYGIYFLRVTSFSRGKIFPHVFVTGMRIANVGPLPAFRRSFEAHWRDKELHEDKDLELFSLPWHGCFGDAGPFWLAKYQGETILFSYDVGTLKIGLLNLDKLDRAPTIEADLTIFAEDKRGKRTNTIRRTVTFRPDVTQAVMEVREQAES